MINLENMQPRTVIIAPKKLVGQMVYMSLADNKTAQLWQTFMPRRREIKNTTGTDLISMQVYDDDLDHFTPTTIHQKWAAAEVSGFEHIPDGMEPFELPGGLYAVFRYIGTPADFADTFRYIFYTWLPASGYELDQRPHFEVLGDKYKNNGPDSEEDIYIPVRKK